MAGRCVVVERGVEGIVVIVAAAAISHWRFFGY